MAGRLLVFTTDFGLIDSYAGVLKGVALSINPDLRLIDLTHQISPQNIAQGSFVLGVGYRYFPADAIHVAVVDPGVGTARRPILLQTPHGSFVAPDNGLLSRVLGEYLPQQPSNPGMVELPPSLKAYHLANPDYWLQPVSSTFHGRDIFTPVAAHLSLGVAPESLGAPTGEIEILPSPQPRMDGDGIRGEVVYCDVYGNLISNIPVSLIADRKISEVRIRGRAIPRVNRTFHDAAPSSGLIALVGSHGYLEVAVPNGSAAATLNAEQGEPLAVTFASP
jgi:S-adenosylmethionine hydrolase